MHADPSYDLLIRAGRLYCPGSGLDGPGAVAVRNGRIAAAGPDVAGPARTRLDVPDGLLLPGLVDLHAHPDRGGASRYGIDPDAHMLPCGVTTVLSQGDAGAASWESYRRDTLDACRTRVRLALNLARRGEMGEGPALARLDDADAAACAAVAGSAPEIWGIAVNTSRASCGNTDPRLILDRALLAAERCGKPLLVGLRRDSDWPLEDQLARIRPGDVVTYCFSPGPEALVRAGRVRPAVWEARRRGVRFDLGHGMASFSFAVAEAALAEGFWPDTISTDCYRRHLGADPPHHLPRVLSKLIAAGMPEAEAFARATAVPSAVLGLAAEIGTLAAGACADLVVLRREDRRVSLKDTLGETRPGHCWEPVLTVRAGEIVGREVS